MNSLLFYTFFLHMMKNPIVFITVNFKYYNFKQAVLNTEIPLRNPSFRY